MNIQQCKFNKVDKTLYFQLSNFKKKYSNSFPDKIVLSNINTTSKNVYAFKCFMYNKNNQLQCVIYNNSNIGSKLCIYNDTQEKACSLA